MASLSALVNRSSPYRIWALLKQEGLHRWDLLDAEHPYTRALEDLWAACSAPRDPERDPRWVPWVGEVPGAWDTDQLSAGVGSYVDLITRDVRSWSPEIWNANLQWVAEALRVHGRSVGAAPIILDTFLLLTTAGTRATGALTREARATTARVVSDHLLPELTHTVVLPTGLPSVRWLAFVRAVREQDEQAIRNAFGVDIETALTKFGPTLLVEAWVEHQYLLSIQEGFDGVDVVEFIGAQHDYWLASPETHLGPWSVANVWRWGVDTLGFEVPLRLASPPPAPAPRVQVPTAPPPPRIEPEIVPDPILVPVAPEPVTFPAPEPTPTVQVNVVRVAKKRPAKVPAVDELYREGLYSEVPERAAVPIPEGTPVYLAAAKVSYVLPRVVAPWTSAAPRWWPSVPVMVDRPLLTVQDIAGFPGTPETPIATLKKWLSLGNYVISALKLRPFNVGELYAVLDTVPRETVHSIVWAWPYIAAPYRHMNPWDADLPATITTPRTQRHRALPTNVSLLLHCLAGQSGPDAGWPRHYDASRVGPLSTWLRLRWRDVRFYADGAAEVAVPGQSKKLWIPPSGAGRALALFGWSAVSPEPHPWTPLVATEPGSTICARDSQVVDIP